MNSQVLDLAFHITASGAIPCDHGYCLFASLCKHLPFLHSTPEIAIHPITGCAAGDGLMLLNPCSRLIFRTPMEWVSRLLSLTDKSLRLQSANLRIGVPELRCLKPATTLRSRLVVIKTTVAPKADLLTKEIFQSAIEKRLRQIGLSASPLLRVSKRRALRIKNRRIVGYELVVTNLSPSDSLILQATGLGGRQHMGCGILVPYHRTRS